LAENSKPKCFSNYPHRNFCFNERQSTMKDKITDDILNLLPKTVEPKTEDEIRQEQKFRGSWIQGRVNVVYRDEIKRLRKNQP
jgi:hypothetical protein